MYWALLLVGILLDVAGTIALRISEGMTRPFWNGVALLFYGSSLFPFGMALKKIDISVGFAIWSALEMVLITSIGILWFREAASPLKMVSLGLILVGVVTLNLSSGGNMH
ncbi:MAG: SMR family transporter [Acidobacteriales bacterium]|nr:SMR family transporter [Terriglobales bacterium]